MREQVILLLAGLAAVASLPVLKEVSPHTSDLLKLIVSANPDDNDLHTLVLPPKPEEQVAQIEPAQQEPQPENQSSPQPEDQSPQLENQSPQLKNQPEDQPSQPENQSPQLDNQSPEPENQSPQLEDQSPEPENQSPQLEDQPPQPEDQPPQPEDQSPQLEDQPPQTHELSTDQREGSSYPLVFKDESQPNVFHPLSLGYNGIPVNKGGNLISINIERLVGSSSQEYEVDEEDDLHPDIDMETFPDGSSNENDEVFQADEEINYSSPLDISTYQEEMAPLSVSEEEEPFMTSLEETQEEPLPYNYDENAYAVVPGTASLLLDPKELVLKTLPDDFQDDFASYYPVEMNSPILHVESTFLDEEPWDSGFEDLSQEVEEEPFKADEYHATEEDQPGWEDTPSVPEDALLEEPYHESESDTELDLFSWLVNDFFDDEPTEIDDYPHDPDYNDNMAHQNPFIDTPEMHNDDWMEPSTPEIFEDTFDYGDSFPDYEEYDVLEGETHTPLEGSSINENNDYVSLEDFFIPIDDSVPSTDVQQNYPVDNTEDAREDSAFFDGDRHFLETYAEPDTNSHEDDMGQDNDDHVFDNDILFPQNPSFEEERAAPWLVDDNEDDQTEYSKAPPTTIFENPPTYIEAVEIDGSFPSLLQILKRETMESRLDGPLMERDIDIPPNSDAMDNDYQHEDEDYAFNSLDGDTMDILLIKEPRQDFNSYSASPFVDYPSHIERYPSAPISQYTGPQRPHWATWTPKHQQYPKFSGFNEFLNRQSPAVFDDMEEAVSFPPMLSHRAPQSPNMRNPFILSKAMHDASPAHHYMMSPNPSSQFKSIGPYSFSSPRSYPDESKTRGLAFRALLQRLSPSVYDNIHFVEMGTHNSPMYPQPSNTMQYRSYPPHQFPITPSPPPFWSPFNVPQTRDYWPVQHTRPQPLPLYSPRQEQSGFFPGNALPNNAMSSRQPRRAFGDAAVVDSPFVPFNTPRPPFPFVHQSVSPINPPHYMSFPVYSNRFFGMSPRQATPVQQLSSPQHVAPHYHF